MKSAILYVQHAPSPDHTPIHPTLHVRVEIFDLDVLEALDAATPREGETVLNSVPLNDE